MQGAFFLWYEIRSGYSHILISALSHRCFIGPLKKETVENIFYLFMLKWKRTLLAPSKTKSRVLLLSVHFVLLSSSASYFRGNKLESNKYSFCNELDIFNTLFLTYNFTWLNELQNLLLLIWKIYNFKSDTSKETTLKAFYVSITIQLAAFVMIEKSGWWMWFLEG